MSHKFKLIRSFDGPRDGQTRKVWEIDEDHYVMTSAIPKMWDGRTTTSSETFIFPCDANGRVKNWCELSGSIIGYMDHGMAIGRYIACLDRSDGT